MTDWAMNSRGEEDSTENLIPIDPKILLDMISGDIRILIRGNVVEETQTLESEVFVGFGRVPTSPSPQEMIAMVLRRILARVENNELERVFDEEDQNMAN